MTDYSELIVALRARSLRIEKALTAKDWRLAAELQATQIVDEIALARWIAAR